MKGKPWSVEEETELRALIEAKTPMETIAAKLKRHPSAIYIKCLRLGLTDKPSINPSSVPLPEELPSVEETLKMLAAALETASIPGLEKAEVQRLQVIATLAKTYKEILADFINYREIEAKLNDMEAKYETLLKEKTISNRQDDAPESNPAKVEEAATNQRLNPESQPRSSTETKC